MPGAALSPEEKVSDGGAKEALRGAFVTDPLLDDSRQLHAAIQARGGSSELHIYPGEIHGFNAMLWRPNAQAKWKAVFEFLSRQVPGAPPVNLRFTQKSASHPKP